MKVKTILIVGILLVILGMLLAACSSKGAPTQSSGSPSTTIDGATLMSTRCNRCHALDRVTSVHKTAEQWKTTVTRMISHGAVLTPDEESVLITYLASTYGQ